MGVLSFARGGILGAGKTSNMLSGNPATSTYELIATANGTGASGIINFTSIPQDYKHLQIRFTAKNSGASQQINLTMNSITSGVYIRHSLLGNSATITSTASTTSQTSIQLIDSMAVSTTASAVNGGIIDILDYASTTKNKTIKAIYGMVDSNTKITLASGLYGQTTAVTGITLTANANNFAAISRFSLYGIRG